jgi:NTP pyrophosphatase (non-canonical NTP hydrolase)
MKLNDLQQQVGEWAKMNFDNNHSKVDRCSAVGPSDTILKEVAPLLGIFEELGEFAEGDMFGTKVVDQREKQRDALGDVGIYLCDFTSRLGIPLEEVANATPSFTYRMHPYQLLLYAAGRIAHANLKHHQGIRGMDQPIHYDTEMRSRLGDFINLLKTVSSTALGEDFWSITVDTWEKIVAKRNWKANKQTGTTAQGFSGPALSDPKEQGINNLGSV